jgi:cyclic dehypoxanthinyl futalosine synthase
VPRVRRLLHRPGAEFVGADDIGSTVIEENVVASAGTHYTTSTEELVHLIRAFGKVPAQRDTYYREIRAY